MKAEHPGWNLTILNRGVSGNGLDDLHARWDEDCLQLQPSVVSLLIGINATLRKFNGQPQTPPRPDVSVAGFRNLYHSLFQRTRDGLGQVRLVVCGPFLLRTGQVTAAWEEDLSMRAVAAEETARHFGATFVPLQAEFNSACKLAPPDYWAYDGFHPTAAGHHLIAKAWMQAVMKQGRRED